MPASKKRDKLCEEAEESESKHAYELVSLAEVISENILKKNLTPTDPFELYVQSLKTHLHANPELFKMRFLEGYHVLLEELKKSIP